MFFVTSLIVIIDQPLIFAVLSKHQHCAVVFFLSYMRCSTAYAALSEIKLTLLTY